MSETRPSADDLFEAALEVPEAERGAWLERACRGDAALLREVEELLAAHALSRGILDLRAAASPSAPTMRRIGPYRVHRELGRGGMGVVYLAERDDGQFRRLVAIKLLRASPDAEELRSRFLAERQILASLDHPNIAQLLDAGVTDGQLPYLVMEYVEGLPITTYCDRHRLDVKARLRLFQSVCAAVHHAHRNLVIHRDLKPGNILVTASGQVKLLDFGIAKLQNPVLGGVPLAVTRTDVRVMTPEYASPEQVRGEPLSTASDIYALGVVLYELLTGWRPHELRGAGSSAGELAGLIDAREPVRPSVAVATRHGGAGDGRASANDALTPAAVAAARDTTPERLSRALKGDLDAIVMMALRSEPSRRYGSADLLAEDIRRYLEGQPVLAHKGSRRYYARKYLERHRAVAAVAALAVLSLATGAGVAVWQAGVARTERDRAELARAEAEAALRQAEEALRHSEEVTAFLVGLFEAGDPTASAGDLVTARDLLGRGMARIEALSGQPLVQARMLEAVGRVYRSMNRQADARALIARALALRTAELGYEHVEVARTLHLLADVMRREGRYAEAEARSREALRLQEMLRGPDHPQLAETLIQLSGLAIYRDDYVAADTLARRALRIREADPAAEDSAVVASLIHLASVLRRTGGHAEAEHHLRRGIELSSARYGPDHPATAEPMRYLAYQVAHVGRLDEAEQLLRTVLDIRRRTVGPAHITYAYVLGDLASLHSRKGQHEEAARLIREEVDVLRRAYGPEYGDVSLPMGRLASELAEMGRLEEAEATAREAVELARRGFGADHQVHAGALGSLAHVLQRRGRFAEAESTYHRAIEIRARANGPNSRSVGIMRADLGAMLAARGRAGEAERELLAGLAIVEQTALPEDEEEFQTILRNIVAFYEGTGRHDDAARFRARVRGR